MGRSSKTFPTRGRPIRATIRTTGTARPNGQVRRTGGVVRGGRKISSPRRWGERDDARDVCRVLTTRGAGVPVPLGDCHLGRTGARASVASRLHVCRTTPSVSGSAGSEWAQVQGASGSRGQTPFAQRWHVCSAWLVWTCGTRRCTGALWTSIVPASASTRSRPHRDRRNGRDPDLMTFRTWETSITSYAVRDPQIEERRQKPVKE